MSIEKRRFSWEGFEVERNELINHAKEMKKFGDDINEKSISASAVSHGILRAFQGKSDDPLFIAYVKESNAIFNIRKRLVKENHFDWLFVTAEYQTIVFPYSSERWKQNIQKAMIANESSSLKTMNPF